MLTREALSRIPTPLATTAESFIELKQAGRALEAVSRLKDALDVAVRILAGVALAARLQLGDRPTAKLSSHLTRLVTPRGLSFGEWLAILRQVLVDLPEPRSAASPRDAFALSVLHRLQCALVERKERRWVNRPLMKCLERGVAWRNAIIGHGSWKLEREYWDEVATVEPCWSSFAASGRSRKVSSGSRTQRKRECNLWVLALSTD